MTDPRDDDHIETEPVDPASKTQPAEGGVDEVEEGIEEPDEGQSGT